MSSGRCPGLTEPGSTPGVGTRIAVADAGPLIHLDELACLNLLTDFLEVRVPKSVWREVEHHRPQALLVPGIPWLRCSAQTSEKVDAVGMLYTLHPGEREALALCVDSPDALLLTDDTAARLAARTLAIEAHGTLGLLVRAIRRHQMTKAEVLERLREIPLRTSLHIRPALLTEVIARVAEIDQSKQ